MKYLIISLFFFLFSSFQTNDLQEVPVFYKGRVRPFHAYATLWLKNNVNADELAWKILFYGPDQIPAELKDKIESFDGKVKVLPETYSLDQLRLALEKGDTLKIKQEAYELKKAYSRLEGKPYLKSSLKTLTYPTALQLTAENLAYKIPFVQIAFSLYFISFILYLLKWARSGLAFFILGFAIHSLYLAIRVYVMQRPPVSNMFESVIYVPWVAALSGLIAYVITKKKIILLASALAGSALLIILYATGISSGMENVQAVLDSQYWLLIHVLMVVGSYGLFIISGILAHFYLVLALFKKEEPQHLSKIILNTMYAGVALLVPGTILGGIWALESWGRFWDWDPKESWAFISSCIYLAWIHAYRFKLIKSFGLAIGAVSGLLAITFTWYGVNYILGTGLHSYGFGSGGEIYYYLFISFEVLFLSAALLFKEKFSFHKV